MYNEFGTEINNISVDIEKIKDDLRDDVYWRTFERAHQSCERLQEVLSGINALIDDNSLFDKNGNLTDYGASRIANLVKSFENARTEVSNYSKDIANLNKLYSSGYYTEQEYKEKLNELQKGMLGSASDMKSYQDSIVEMYKTMAQSELDALNKLIDKRAEALNKKKAYYEYDKNIKKQTDDLQTLQAQLAALEGINSLEANAKRRKLELEITEKQEELDDTVQDHIFDLSQEALNDLKETLQDAFDEKWENISGNLKEIAVLMGEAKTLMYEEVGKYYTGGTPVLYQRTGTLGSSPRTTNLSGGGNVISFDAYLDQSGGYEGENARLQAMGFKSYFSTLQAYTAAEHGTDHVKGNPGFWARSEQRMQQELDSVMGSYFN